MAGIELERRGGLAAVKTPAAEGAVRADAAGVFDATTDGGEDAGGRGGLASIVAAPAGNFAAGAHAAGVKPAGTDGAKGAGRGRGFTEVVGPQQATFRRI